MNSNSEKNARKGTHKKFCKVGKKEILQKKRECEQRRQDAIKNDPEKREAQKQKEKERYLKRKQEGKIKMIGDLTLREQRLKRKKWNQNNKNSRSKKVNTKKLDKFMSSNTPPETPSVSEDDEIPLQYAVRFNNENQNRQPDLNDSILSKAGSCRKSSGRKKVRRDRTRMYRKLKENQAEIKTLKQRVDRYRKKYERLAKKQAEVVQIEKLTPNSKVQEITKNIEVPEDVKRRLLFGEVVKSQLTQQFLTMRDEKSKQIFTKAVGGDVLKKYKQLVNAKMFLPYKYYKSNKSRNKSLIYERKKRASTINIKEDIKTFLENDDNSRLCPGKRDLVKRRSVKQQKRYLNNTLQNLHKRFCRTTGSKIHYVTFCRLRPFWIVPPKVGARDTCLGVKHENMNLVVQRLKFLNVIEEKCPRGVVKSLCCLEKTENCLERTCSKCKENIITYLECDLPQPCTYFKWVTKKEKRISNKTGKEITVQRTLKEELETTKGDLVNELEKDIFSFICHLRNIKHQYEAITYLKCNMGIKDMLVHIDFSENFCCKYSSELQSVHFGASRQQITLHTGVIYNSKFKKSFCTVSESLRHDPIAIMAHLLPIITMYLKEFPHITRLHFLSDSPSTQYRNKTMFNIILKYIPKRFLSITGIYWNYSEAGHGKGAPDGVGATLKRTADRLVAQNSDVDNYEKFVKVVKENINNIDIVSVTPEDIVEIENNIPREETTVKGTMKVHKVTWNAFQNTLQLNSLTCQNCEIGTYCSHYNISSIIPPEITHSQTQDSENDKVSTADRVEEVDKIEQELKNDELQPLPIKKGDWVAVMYDKWYPGIVECVENSNLKISYMQRVGDKFYWPSLPDKQTIPAEEVLYHFKEPPFPCSSRHFLFTETKEVDIIVK